MVKKITAVDDIIDFVFIMNSKPETSCKMIPSERELLKELALLQPVVDIYNFLEQVLCISSSCSLSNTT